MRTTFSVVATLLAGLAAAQNEAPGYGAPATLSDSAIAILPIETKQGLCGAQYNTCQQLCLPDGPVMGKNLCDPTTLEWTCVCSSDNKTPDLAAYAQSVPAQLCQDYVNNCVAGNTTGSNSAYLQKECMAIPCGKKVVVVPTGSTTSAMATSTAAKKTSATPHSGGAATSASSAAAAATSTGAAAAVLQLGQTYGTGALAAGILAMFGMAM